MFLGLSESVDEGARLFAPLDKKHRLYTRRTAFSAALSVPSQPTSCGRRHCRLQQVLWNLLKNASKFTPEGGEIPVTSRNETSLILVEIPDTGIGIEPEALSTIFNAFNQGSEGIAREFGGLGLGLAISKATV